MNQNQNESCKLKPNQNKKSVTKPIPTLNTNNFWLVSLRQWCKLKLLCPTPTFCLNRKYINKGVKKNSAC